MSAEVERHRADGGLGRQNVSPNKEAGANVLSAAKNRTDDVTSVLQSRSDGRRRYPSIRQRAPSVGRKAGQK